MRKRYWVIGAFVVYAFVRQLGGEPELELAPVRVSPPATHTSQPEPPKPSPATQPIRPEPPAPVPATPVERFVTGNGVAFRSGPSTADTIIDRFDRGRAIQLLEQAGDWSKVQDGLTRREGWIASRFLGDRPAAKSPEARKSPKPPKPVAAPTVSDTTIIARIIAESIASYPGSCPCPYNTDRGGRRCGKRSAYSKPGGYAPVCFKQDVSRAMIEAFRLR